MKPIFQMTREEKLQEIVEYSPCRVERSTVLRYLLALRRNDTEQIAYFESFGKSVRHIILNVRTYERGLIFGYVGKRFNEHGWINGMLPIVKKTSGILPTRSISGNPLTGRMRYPSTGVPAQPEAAATRPFGMSLSEIIRKLSGKASACWNDNTTKRNVGLFPTEAITTRKLSAV